MSDKVYDLGQLEELAGGSQEFVMSMVETFLEHTPGQLEELKTAFSSGDLGAMGGVAHKIKPNIDLFGVHSIREEIRLVENLGKEKINAPELPATIGKIDSVLQLSFQQLAAHKNG